jgi:NAD(P)H-hydrate epimerase
MENAGAGAARIVRELAAREPDAYPEPILIVCGPGNNGGDGLVVARHLDAWGIRVEVIIATASSYPSESDAGRNLAILRRAGSPPILEPHSAGAPPTAEEMRRLLAGGTIVDALFGTGLSREVRAPYREWIEAMESSGRTLVALDIPSGLDADSGEVLGAAVRAAHTITFAASKPGFSRALGPAHCGVVHLVDIGLPRRILDSPDR